MITSFDGINLYSKDPAALAAFYSEVYWGYPFPLRASESMTGRRSDSSAASPD